MKHTFFLIDLLNLPVVIIIAFLRRDMLTKKWKAFLFPSLITGGVFVLINSYFTYLSVWKVSDLYVHGLKIANLYIEEILFCFCISFSCVFSFGYLYAHIKKPLTYWKEVEVAFVVFLFDIALFLNHNIFDFFVFSTLATLLLIAKFICKIRLLSRFYFIISLVFFPLLLINYLLSANILGVPIISYNDSAILGTRIFTIPVEIPFYDMSLIIMNLLIYYHFFYKKLL
jgi:lycopene cyclase domain-containing protein